MAGHKSIGQRIRKRSYTLEQRRDVALEWAAAWEREHHEALGALHAVVRADPRLGPLLGRLQEVHARKFEGLSGVIRALSDPEVAVDVSDA